MIKTISVFDVLQNQELKKRNRHRRLDVNYITRMLNRGVSENGDQVNQSSSHRGEISSIEGNDQLQMRAEKLSEELQRNSVSGNSRRREYRVQDGNDLLAKRFYIDELGFYRLLDLEKGQYNYSEYNPSTVSDGYAASQAKNMMQTVNSDTNGNSILTSNLQHRNSIAVNDCYENCLRFVRRELGISHFDRISNNKIWKKDWDTFISTKLSRGESVIINSEFKRRIRSGIPHDYRFKVWTALINMRTRKIKQKFGDDLYEVLHNYCSNLSEELNNPATVTNASCDSDNFGIDTNTRVPSREGKQRQDNEEIILKAAGGKEKIVIDEKKLKQTFKQIELDLLRTMPSNKNFEDPNSNGIKRIRRVLQTYACFDQSVGYCQGMNRLTAMALLVLPPEKEAFWCLLAIVQCIMPKDYYLKPWLAQVDCNVLNELIKKSLPKLADHFAKNDIQMTLFSWFFTVFVNGFRPEIIIRIWDCFLYEGDKVLFRFALAVLYVCQDELMKMDNSDSIAVYLNNMVSTSQIDEEQLFDVAFKTLKGVPRHVIQLQRELFRKKFALTIEDT